MINGEQLSQTRRGEANNETPLERYRGKTIQSLVKVFNYQSDNNNSVIVLVSKNKIVIVKEKTRKNANLGASKLLYPSQIASLQEFDFDLSV